MTNRLGAAGMVAPLVGADSRVWLLFPPDKKGDPNPLRTAAEEAAAIVAEQIRWLTVVLVVTECVGVSVCFSELGMKLYGDVDINRKEVNGAR